MTRLSAGDDLGPFLSTAARCPLLTPEEELALGDRVRAGMKAAARVMELAEAGVDECTLDRYGATVEDGLAARNEFVEANLGLVVWVAKRYRSSGLPLADLVQEGMFGLMRAAEKFDPDRGFRFSTYATGWIEQACQRAIQNSGEAVRLPIGVADRVRSLGLADRELSRNLGRDPTVSELAEATGFTPERVCRLQEIRARHFVSLDTPVGDDPSGATLSDVVPDSDAPDPVDCALATETRETLVRALDRLPPREGTVLRLRYGLDDDEPRDRRDIPDVVDVGGGPDAVRGIERRAFARILHPAGLPARPPADHGGRGRGDRGGGESVPAKTGGAGQATAVRETGEIADDVTDPSAPVPKRIVQLLEHLGGRFHDPDGFVASALARRLGVTKQAVADAIRELVDSGAVTRHSDAGHETTTTLTLVTSSN